MNKTWAVIIVFVIAAIIGVVFTHSKQSATKVTVDPGNAAYVIGGETVTLVNGMNQAPAAPGSAAMVQTKLFTESASADLNGDGVPDVAVILTQNSGGSGTFYYAAAAIASQGSTKGTNAILLGDRIAPQNIFIQNGQVVVNYADHKPNEPFTTQPSVAVTKYFTLQDASTLQEANRAAGAGEACGGNMTTAPTCITGYHCAPRSGSHLPFGDIGGICIAN